MRITRVYFPEPIHSGQQVRLPPDSAHHVATVLRMKVDERVSLFNPQAGEFLAHIVAVKKGDVELSVNEQIATFREPGLRVVLCLGISRGDRMDFGIQKSVELGVSEIRPFYSEYGDIRIKPQDRVEKKTQHWQKIAVSATEQCGRLDVPVVAAPAEFSSCLEASPDSTALLDPRGDGALSQLEVSDRIHLFIGPEGGFSDSEIEAARNRGCAVVKLGPRILRTETAPIAALAILQNRFGDM